MKIPIIVIFSIVASAYLSQVVFIESSNTFRLLGDAVEKTVSFKVVNGSWNDDTDGEITVTLRGNPENIMLRW